MTPDRPDKIEALFHQALDCDPARRAAFLEEACQGDASLKEAVERLLESHRKSTHFMEKPAWEVFAHLDGKEEGAAEPLEAEPNLPCERLGEFRLIKRIGEGGMGVVYLAVQESLGRKVALKVIHPDRMGSSEAEARFWREVEAVTGLRHSHLVTVYGSGEDQGIRYFAMEYVPGQRLDEALHEAAVQGKKIPLAQALGWIRDVAHALDSAHQAGILHRDVKPSNIRIKPDGQPMLLDFGLARHGDLASLTLTGEFRGTPHYASPEQVKARRGGMDERTDIYSLGVTLYETITGRVPFKAETTEQLFHQILVEEPPSPRSVHASIPRDLETVILKAMEKEPERRYATMADFADDLGRLMRGEMILARPSGFATRFAKRVQRNPALSTAVAVALAAVIVLALTLPIYFSQQAESRYLVDGQQLGRLLDQAERLWPAHPEKVPAMEAWLVEAERLSGRLQAHRQALAELRESALPREGGPEAEPVWIFEDRSLQTRHATLQELVAGLEKFMDNDRGLLKQMEGLLHFSRNLHDRSLGKYEEEWKQASASIADRAVCPAYEGLALDPMLGLAPLGRDPHSGLWEFAHLQTGKVPARGPEGELEITEESGLVFVLVPGGRFSMGAALPDAAHPEGSPNVDSFARPMEGPVHEVTLAPFLLSKYEMSQAQWLRFTGENPSHYQPTCYFGDKQHSLLHNVENVSWEEAAATLARLGLRLPSEAEWEYAARGGTTTIWWTGQDKKSLDGAANLMDQACLQHQGATETPCEEWLDDGYVVHAPVHTFRANPFGFHNVCGNAYEWCDDAWHSDYEGAPTDGSAWSDPRIALRVCRDACWDGMAPSCRMAYRIWRDKDYRDCGLGLRPACSLKRVR